MAKFWESLSERGKANWAALYKQLTGKEWILPKKDERGIQCDVKIEDVEEIDRLMRQKANPTRRE